MKYLFAFLLVLGSFGAVADSQSSSAPVGTPYTPCFIDNVYIGTYEVTTCWAKGGTVYTE